MENKKIGFKTIFHDLIESIGLKQGVLITIKDLIIKPEEVVKYFIETRRNEKMDISKYLSPLKLFMFIFAAIAIISFVTGYDILNGESKLYEENEKYFYYEDGYEYLEDTEYYVALDDFYKNYENEQWEKYLQIYEDTQIVFSLIIVLVTALFSKLFFFKRKDYNLASHFVIYVYFGSIMIMVAPLTNLAAGNMAIWIDLLIGCIYITYFVIRIFKNSLIIGLIKGLFIFLIPNILFFEIFFTLFYIPSYQEDENLLRDKFLIKYPQFKDYETCKGDCENGFGVWQYVDGVIYEGNWKDDLRHGQGVCTYDDGSKYEGNWKDDLMHGNGTFTWADGEKYEGEWKDDLMHGQGTYAWGDGSEWAGDKYVGEYQDGERHGQGTMTYADGTKESGLWENDEFLGE